MSDVMLMAGIAAGCIVFTSIFWVLFNSQRIYDMQLEHVEDMQDANQEILDLRDKLAGREIRDRVLGSTPVGRLMDTAVGEETP